MDKRQLEDTIIEIIKTIYDPEIPVDIYELGLIYNIDIKSKQYAQATTYLKKIIKLTPQAIEPRQKWAELAGQQSNYSLSLTLWKWIYKVSNDPKHLQKVIQVAQLDLNKKGLTTLRQIARQQELPVQAVYDVFFHLVNLEKKNIAEQFLSQYLTSYHSKRELSETLAKWYSGEKRYAEALQVWNKIETQFGHNITSSLNRFELLWVLKHKQQAYQLWLENKKIWDQQTNPQQLSIMAEVAWQYKQTRVALSYYNQLLQQGYKRSLKEYELQYMRIAILNKKLGRPKIALAMYRKGFIKTRRSALLINGLQLSFDQRDMKNFTRLTSLARRYKQQFRSKSRYWLLQAAYAQRNKNYHTALNY
jgi:hypothetical protein